MADKEKEPPHPWCDRHQILIERMVKDMYGNGKEGMLDKVRRIDIMMKVVVALLTPAFIATSGLIIQFIFKHLGL